MLPLSIICNSKTHCTTCRDLDNGRAWRESLSRHYAVPGENTDDGGVDFPCPHGKQWDDITPTPVGLTTTLSASIRPAMATVVTPSPAIMPSADTRPAEPRSPIATQPTESLPSAATRHAAICRECDEFNFNGSICELKFPAGGGLRSWHKFLQEGRCPMSPPKWAVSRRVAREAM